MAQVGPQQHLVQKLHFLDQVWNILLRLFLRKQDKTIQYFIFYLALHFQNGVWLQHLTFLPGTFLLRAFKYF